MEFFDRVKGNVTKDVEVNDEQIRAVIAAVLDSQEAVRFEMLGTEPREVR